MKHSSDPVVDTNDNLNLVLVNPATNTVSDILFAILQANSSHA